MFMNEQDALSGKQAKAFATINGQVEELFYARTGEVTIEKVKSDVPVLGKTNVGQKSSGWRGTGTLNVYYVTSKFRELMVNYIKTGEDFYFDLQIINDDPQSRAGRQATVARNCNLDSLILARFDATSDEPLNEDLPFTFSDADILDSFSTITV